MMAPPGLLSRGSVSARAAARGVFRLLAADERDARNQQY
jgi:hypothetical protein